MIVHLVDVKSVNNSPLNSIADSFKKLRQLVTLSNNIYLTEDPLLINLHMCLRILESSGGALNVLPSKEGRLSTVVFSIAMQD